MRLLLAPLLLGALMIGAANAAYSVFEALPQVPPGWTETDAPVDADKKLSLRIMLTPQNVEAFQQRVVDLSTPEHPSYGAHMTPAQIQQMLQPESSASEAVLSWLAARGLRQRADVTHDSVKLVVSVGEAEALLQTKYRHYWHAEDERTVLRTLEYSLPEELHPHVALVQPTTMFGMRTMKSTLHNLRRKPAPASLPTTTEGDRLASGALNTTFCNSTITLQCLQELYNFAGHTSGGQGSLGITGYLEQAAIHADLTTFLQRFAPAAAATADFSVVSINGGENAQNGSDADGSAEANLDVQYGIGIGVPRAATFFTTGGRPPFIPEPDETQDDNEPYLDFLEFVLGQTRLPHVVTTSYGENEQTVPPTYRAATCNLFAQLGARGVSVVFSSGDSGPGSVCVSNDGTNTTEFNPVFPASCPFVTSVGATQFVAPEHAAFFSSGGFSNSFARPAYQQAAVQRYFQNTDKYTPFLPFFNRTGRAMPDVAFQGVNFEVVIFGQLFLLDGTSCSAPSFAGLITLLNHVRLGRGETPLGFLNPWLYGRAAGAFNDITRGRSTGCTGGSSFGGGAVPGAATIPGAGWDAVEGWDPVTGLGTPDFVKLLQTV